MRRSLGVLGVFLVVVLGLAGQAVAAAPVAGPTSEDCLGCHSDKDLTKEAHGKKVSLFADEAVLKASVHGRLQCTACHAGIKEVPHPEKLPSVSCKQCHAKAATVFGQSIHGRKDGPQLDCQSCHGSHDVGRAAKLGTTPCQTCHAETVEKYQGSIHGQAVAHGVKEAARCTDCHGEAHQVRAQADPDSPTGRTKMAETCGRCHADRALIERRKIPIPRAYELYQKSVHGRAVAAGKPAATCNSCHESHDLQRANNPKSSIYRENVPKTCGQCHAQEAKVYLESIHGTAMLHGATKAPVCIDCHGEHSITAVQNPNSPVSVAKVTKTCVSCHDAEGITEKYGLPGGRLASYTDSFHGLAARGGSVVAANCASCHGFHDIRPSEDSKSSISKANLPDTCGKCHPGAGENFAKGAVHVSVTQAEEPILFYVRNFYLLTIVLTIGGMAAHNGLDFLKKLRRSHRRWRGMETAGEDDHDIEAEGFVLRMHLAERFQHATLAMSFLVLVYTGFALKFPDTWLFAWLVALEKGAAIRGWVHRGAAVVMVLACLWHLAYLPTRRGRSLLLAMLPRFEDAREVLQNLGYLLGLRAEPPRFDRFSYIEKAEYLALIWGSVVKVVTGFALWFENLALQHFPKWMLDLATMVHYYEAWLATLAIVVWHFYMVMFNPDVYPMNWTWLTGKISTTMLRHEHPREYERLRAQETSADPADPDDVTPA
jgi:cytochrome b subunit of formate dehydrogenase